MPPEIIAHSYRYTEITRHSERSTKISHVRTISGFIHPKTCRQETDDDI